MASAKLDVISLRQAETIEAFFEKAMEGLGLSRGQVEQQSLAELRVSLTKIEDLISHPDGLGYFSMTADGGLFLASTQFKTVLGPLPFLINRKASILERINQLVVSDSFVAEIRAEIQKTVTDEDVVENLLTSVDEAAKGSQALASERQKEIDAIRASQIRLELEVKERRSQMYLSWLAKEPIAGLIGGLLLLAFGVTLIVAAFTKVSLPELLQSAFLLILGYFFGQGTKRDG